MNIDAHHWNEIAKEELTSNLGKRYFHLTNEQLVKALDADADHLEAKGFDPRVVRAFQVIAPHLSERQAISRYAKKNPAFRQTVPEVVDTREALILASREFSLNTSQQAQLNGLLNAL
jgi:hypothetical protein